MINIAIRKAGAEPALRSRAGVPQDLRILTFRPLDAMIAVAWIGRSPLKWQSSKDRGQEGHPDGENLRRPRPLG